jgi:hypothetical protein
MAQFYRFVIPKEASVLCIGYKNSALMHVLKSQKVAYYQTREQCTTHDTFDYIMLSSTIMDVYDIQSFFESLHQFCTLKTRIIVDTHNPLWEPTLWLLQKLHLRRPTPFKNWISKADIKNFLMLANFDVVTDGNHILFPVYIPIISTFINSFIAMLPLLNKLCLNQWIIARPQIQEHAVPTVSVIIPCRNEKGNIESAVNRCPVMGASTEIIFVEGHSKDGTLDEIKRVTAQHPEKNIRYCIQPGKGKGDAVRVGFDMAHGDILMILDADLTVPPEELPKFYDALVHNKGEFINGSRLVYGMEDEAMRFLNLIANYLFGVGFSWLLSQRIKDTLCGTKVLYKKDYQQIARNRAFFGDFDPFGDFDLLFGAAKQNLKIVDLPVHYKARVYGETQIRRFYHGVMLIRMFWVALWKFKIK